MEKYDKYHVKCCVFCDEFPVTKSLPAPARSRWCTIHLFAISDRWRQLTSEIWN